MRHLLRALCMVWAMGFSLATQSQAKFDYFLFEAESCYREGDYAAAMALYRHCHALDSCSAQVNFQLGMCYSLLEQDSLGLTFIERACEIEPTNPHFIEILANAYLSQQDFDNAINTLERLAKLQTRRGEVVYELVELYKMAGRTEEAMDALNRLEKIEGISQFISYEKYKMWMDLQNGEKATQELERLCKEFPEDADNHIFLAEHCFYTGDSVRAMAIVDSVGVRHPQNASRQMFLLMHTPLGNDTDLESRQFIDSMLLDEKTDSKVRDFILQNRIRKATEDTSLRPSLEAMFDTLLAQPQTNGNLYRLKGSYLIAIKEDSNKIVETLLQVLHVEPTNTKVISFLQDHYIKTNNYVKLEDVCRIAINANPDQALYHLYLGYAQYNLKKMDEALATMQQTVRIEAEPQELPRRHMAYSLMADIYNMRGEMDNAIAATDSALVYNPNDNLSLNNLAYYLCLKGEQLERAEELSYRAIRAEPNNTTYLDTYAWVLFMMGRYDEARIYIDRVVPPQKNADELLQNVHLNGALIEHAGDIYFLGGDRQTGLWLWQIAAQKNDGTASHQLNKKIKGKNYIK